MGIKLVPTRILTCSISDPDIGVISEAARIINSGGLVVYPTDTFYGLGGDPKNEDTIRRIFQVKGRPENKPLPLIIGCKSDLDRWVGYTPPVSERLIEHFWPGPLTIVFKCKAGLPSILTAGSDKVGIRWPKFSIASSIATEANTAIISTSANFSGTGGIINQREILRDFDGLVDLIIDSGYLQPTKGSTIVDVTCMPIRILREGDIPKEILKEIAGNE